MDPKYFKLRPLGKYYSNSLDQKVNILKINTLYVDLGHMLILYKAYIQMFPVKKKRIQIWTKISIFRKPKITTGQ